MLPIVAVIIVNWNGKTDTLECLASLRQDCYPNKQIIVVDNGSADDSISVLRATHPDVTVLETGANLGFTGGNNTGIEYALQQGVDYLYLLNNDTTVEPDALQALVEAAEADASYGLLTPVIHYYEQPEETWFAGSRIDLARGIAVHDNHRVPARTEGPIQIPWASGCAMLLRAALMRQLGGLDERYFLNWEDVDFSLRVRALGSNISLVPAARIYHKVGRSFGASSGVGHYYYVRNNLLLVLLHGGSLYHRAALSIVLNRLRENLRAIKNRRVNASNSIGITCRAIYDHSLRRYGRRFA